MPIRLRYRWTANENEPCHYIIMCVLCEFEYVITFFGCLFRYCTVVKNCERARRITRNSIRTMHKRFVIGLGLVPIVFSSLLGSFFHSISAVLCVSCRFTFNFNGIAVWAVELSLSNTIIRLKYTHTDPEWAHWEKKSRATTKATEEDKKATGFSLLVSTKEPK